MGSKKNRKRDSLNRVCQEKGKPDKTKSPPLSSHHGYGNLKSVSSQGLTLPEGSERLRSAKKVFEGFKVIIGIIDLQEIFLTGLPNPIGNLLSLRAPPGN